MQNDVKKTQFGTVLPRLFFILFAESKRKCIKRVKNE